MQELLELSDEDRELAMSRFLVPQPHLEQERPLRVVATEAGLAFRTAQRWVAQYRTSLHFTAMWFNGVLLFSIRARRFQFEELRRVRNADTNSGSKTSLQPRSNPAFSAYPGQVYIWTSGSYSLSAPDGAGHVDDTAIQTEIQYAPGRMIGGWLKFTLWHDFARHFASDQRRKLCHCCWWRKAHLRRHPYRCNGYRRLGRVSDSRDSNRVPIDPNRQ
jgi:hypothetical protein